MVRYFSSETVEELEDRGCSFFLKINYNIIVEKNVDTTKSLCQTEHSTEQYTEVKSEQKDYKNTEF